MTIEAEIQDIKEMLDDLPDDFAKYSIIIEMGDELEPYPEEFKLDELKVPGGQSDLWMMVDRKDDIIHYRAVSDAVIVKGLVALMLQILNDRTQVEIQNFDIDLLKELGIKGLLTPGRQNGVSSLIQRIQLLAA